MSEKPGKRLVSWSVYLRTLRNQWILTTFAVVSTALGLVLGLLAVVFFCRDFNFDDLPSLLLGSGVLFSFAYGSLWLGRSLFQVVKENEPVIPITRHNTSQLPEVETLVRPSDLPPSHQQAELLRASPQGSETPAEELLRATTNSKED